MPAERPILPGTRCTLILIVLMTAEILPCSPMDLDETDQALSRSISIGAFTAIEECAFQFRFDQWSCPSSAFQLSGLGRQANVTLDSGRAGQDQDPAQNKVGVNREAALVRAMTSAGITYTLAKNCSRGDFFNCLCDARKQLNNIGDEIREEDWTWAGCSDSLHFGSSVSRQFLDSHEDGVSPVSFVNLHNNEAGRVAVKRVVRKLCQCHGVSGSCATRTCWRKLSEFRAIGSHLRKKYKRAKKISFTNGMVERLGDDRPALTGSAVTAASSEASAASSKTVVHATKAANVGDREGEKKSKHNHILYLDDSPDYCRSSPGHQAVLGRTCSSNTFDDSDDDAAANVKKCKKLCRTCGLKAKVEVVKVAVSCNCSVKWCCEVTCQTCTRQRVDVTCEEPPDQNDELPF